MTNPITQAIASPAFALAAFDAQRAGAFEAILAGQAAKLGGATGIDGMKAATIRKGLKKLDAEQDTIDALLAKFERDTSAFVKRGRVWLHVLFVEPDAAEIVAEASVALRTQMGQAMASAGAYNVEGFVAPETIVEAKEAVTDRVAHIVDTAKENDRPVTADNAALARQLGVKGHSTLKVKKKAANGPAPQMRLTLNALAHNVAATTDAPSTWVQGALEDGTALVVNFKSQTEREAFSEALAKAMAK